jgi:NADH-quinone oxidoreductase subunit D
MLCGARVTVSYMRPGGVTQDAPEDFWPALDRFLNDMPTYIDDLEGLISDNEIVLVRTRDIGILSPELAIDSSASGPVLRASGVKWDLRKASPYEVYDQLDFDVPIGSTGDSFDRYLIRIKEMRESVSIIQQCVENIEPGPVRTKGPFFVRPPSGDAYSSIESPRGELGFYLVSDGGISPHRCKIRSPSYINLTSLREMVLGLKMADLIVIFGSIDVNMGEVDR